MTSTTDKPKTATKPRKQASKQAKTKTAPRAKQKTINGTDQHDSFTAEAKTRADDKDTLARLAALPPMEYDRVRQAEADKLGIRVTTLDATVAELRTTTTEAATGRAFTLHEVEPWPEPVGAGELLDDLSDAIGRHVIMSASARTCIAAWVLHTWVFDRFQHTPRLAITSPTKRCGKSTLLAVLHATTRKPIKTDNVTAAAVFRIIEQYSPVSLIIDEADSFLTDREDLRGILNSGFEATGAAVRVVEKNGEQTPTAFRTFAPVALAAIGDLPGTIADRSVPIVLQRKGAGEDATRLRTPGARAALHVIARKAARWSSDEGHALDQDPHTPAQMNDRSADISVPLLALADAAGGAWPERVRHALCDLFGVRSDDDAGGLLLRDIADLFRDLGTDRLKSDDLARRLGEMEERPWPEWRNGKPMTKHQLAHLLAPFGVRSKTIRFGVGTDKGYLRADFEQAWARYL